MCTNVIPHNEVQQHTTESAQLRMSCLTHRMHPDWHHCVQDIDRYLAVERYERAAPSAAVLLQTAWRARGPRVLFNKWVCDLPVKGRPTKILCPCHVAHSLDICAPYCSSTAQPSCCGPWEFMRAHACHAVSWRNGSSQLAAR